LFSDGNSYIKKIDKSSGFINYSGFLSEIDSNNNLWVAADRELIKIEAGSIFENAIKNCRLILKSIEANDEQLDLPKISSCFMQTQEPIILPWYKNSLTFNFDIIKYLDPDNIQFYYTLKNGTGVISEVTSNRSVGFQNLEPGIYEFSINTISENHSKNNNVITIQFIIKNPLYKNLWAIIGFSILLIAIIWFFVKWSTSK